MDRCCKESVTFGGGRTEDQALLVGRQRGGGEVRHGGLLAAQVPSVGEVKARNLAAHAACPLPSDVPEVTAEKNSVLVFLLPIKLLCAFIK